MTRLPAHWSRNSRSRESPQPRRENTTVAQTTGRLPETSRMHATSRAPRLIDHQCPAERCKGTAYRNRTSEGSCIRSGADELLYNDDPEADRQLGRAIGDLCPVRPVP